MEKEKSWFKRHKIHTAIMGFFILIIISMIFNPYASNTSNKGGIYLTDNDTQLLQEELKNIENNIALLQKGNNPKEDTNNKLNDTSHSKYSKVDLKEVRKLAKECKFNMTICSEEYVLRIPTQVETYGSGVADSEILVIIWTPFFSAIKEFSEMEKEYKTYTDDEVIEYLQDDFIHIQLSTGNSLYYKLVDIGRIESVAIKTKSKNYPSESGDYISLGFNNVIRKIMNYSEFYDKEVELIIIGGKGEKIVPLNMNDYK